MKNWSYFKKGGMIGLVLVILFFILLHSLDLFVGIMSNRDYLGREYMAYYNCAYQKQKEAGEEYPCVYSDRCGVSFNKEVSIMCGGEPLTVYNKLSAPLHRFAMFFSDQWFMLNMFLVYIIPIFFGFVFGSIIGWIYGNIKSRKKI
jgi:hypothetical protein